MYIIINTTIIINIIITINIMFIIIFIYSDISVCSSFGWLSLILRSKPRKQVWYWVSNMHCEQINSINIPKKILGKQKHHKRKIMRVSLMRCSLHDDHDVGVSRIRGLPPPNQGNFNAVNHDQLLDVLVLCLDPH